MIPILIDGQLLPSGRPLIVRDNVILAPEHGIIDRFVDRISTARDGSIVVSRRSHHLILYPTQRRAFFDGHLINIPCGPIVQADQAYLPLRTTASLLGIEVRYAAKPTPVIDLRLPANEPVEALTPIPIWYPVVPPHVVITPTPFPRARPTRPPHPELRRTPVPVGPFYRTF